MQVLSAMTQGNWLAELPALPAGAVGNARPAIFPPDSAVAEAKRVISELFYCENLVILAGLGTSLGVEPSKPGAAKAPTMWDLWVRVRDKTNAVADTLGFDFNALIQVIGYPQDETNIEALLSRCRMAEAVFNAEHKAKVAAFVALAEREIADATNFVVANHALPIHEQFLRRIARRSNRKQRAKLFTTNYDRCFEEAARQARLIVNDGFSYSIPSTFDAINFSYDIVTRGNDGERQDFVPNLFHLYKLHGSIDWERDPVSNEVHKVAGAAQPVLIYPRNSKYELAFEQPYLEMIAAFQAALRQPNVGVMVVGFGFNDNHLAEPIMSAIRSNLSLKLVVAGPYLAPHTVGGDPVPRPGEALINAHIRKLAQLAKAGDARLSMINESFNGLLAYVPDIVAQSDMEKHVARMRSLGQVQ
ncbi:SIR2 family protein [Dyella telluris]|uniref:SIR2 family protein n=1 Tax=Dyella telluris TaxID=2763498 RepID=A0A7G8Q3L5_9GAMM|nr:SIR2 family protein [Dyella telluris]QNK01373.1 SIR2 family protein [Dyella telluris]